MSLERMNKLVLNYGGPSRYVYRIHSDDKYIATLGSLEFGMCENEF